MYDNKFIEAFLSIYLYKYWSFLQINFSYDNLTYLLKEEFNFINKKYNNYFTIFFNKNHDICIKYYNFENILDLWNDIIKSIELLQLWFEDNLLLYININFSNDFKKKILPFFNFLELDNHSSKKKYEWYIYNIHNFKLKKMLQFLIYWIWNDTKFNTSKSINILSEIIEKYPKFSSFYLLRMRQTFNLVYKILLWVNTFNKLIDNEIWLKYINNNKFIIKCFNDLDMSNKLIKNNSTYLLFKWKFLLHLLDKKWLEYLSLYLKSEKLLYETNVYSWFGVYYLQKGNCDKAKKYIELVKYEESDRYKAYSKLIFLYIKWNYKDEFIKLFNWVFKKIFVLFYKKWNYYKLNDWKLKLWKDIDDDYNHKDKMWFKIYNFNLLLNRNYNSKLDYLENIYNNISSNYYDHWSSELEEKVVFYSVNYFND